MQNKSEFCSLLFSYFKASCPHQKLFRKSPEKLLNRDGDYLSPNDGACVDYVTTPLVTASIIFERLLGMKAMPWLQARIHRLTKSSLS